MEYDYKTDPKYLEVQARYETKKKQKEERKFKTEDILTEYHYGETKRIL